MVPVYANAYMALTGFPRTSGDGPAAEVAIEVRRLVPPHERGWSLAHLAGIAQ